MYQQWLDSPAPRGAARLALPLALAWLLLSLMAACAPMLWQGPEGVDLPPMGIPGVYEYQRTGTPSVEDPALADLFEGVRAAQVSGTTTPHEPISRSGAHR